MPARLTARFVVRFTFMALCALGALVCLVSLVFFDVWWFCGARPAGVRGAGGGENA